MKKIFFLVLLSIIFLPMFAQESDDDLFFFEDDGIEEFVITEDSKTEELNRGILFETGSIKIGGKFDTSLSTLTTLWADDDENFGTHLKNTSLTPKLSAFLNVDARPTQTLRMYTKFGFAYPFESKAYSSATTNQIGENNYYTQVKTSISDYFKVKELFTDFSINDRAFFRFGLHTVTWGTGYFYSPVSDMINTSSINPEDVDAQVDGSVNLRTQIVFPGSQNCLWFYVIPSTDFKSSYSAESYLRETALAGKADFVLGGWEFGLGGFYKYQNSPKAMFTATGSLKSFSLFGETVYQYGAASEWKNNSDWKDKTNIFQITAGLSRYWKNPSITLAAQYYYDGNNVDLEHQYVTQGHNIAFLANFGRIFGTTDISANIFGMINIGKKELNSIAKEMMKSSGVNSSFLSSAIFSAMMNFSPINEFSFGIGPYITMETLSSKPSVSLKLNASLGGGKF